MVKANLSFPFLSSNYLLTRCFDSKRWYVRNLTASWQFLHMAADETHSLLSRLFEQHLISPWCPKLRKKRSKETLLLRKVLPPTFSIFGCISNKFPLWERRRGDSFVLTSSNSPTAASLTCPLSFTCLWTLLASCYLESLDFLTFRFSNDDRLFHSMKVT